MSVFWIMFWMFFVKLCFFYIIFLFVLFVCLMIWSLFFRSHLMPMLRSNCCCGSDCDFLMLELDLIFLFLKIHHKSIRWRLRFSIYHLFLSFLFFFFLYFFLRLLFWKRFHFLNWRWWFFRLFLRRRGRMLRENFLAYFV